MNYPLNKLKRAILESSFLSGEGHVPSAFSILDILWVVYDRILKFDPKNPDWFDRDRFVLSKGHASLGLYAVLAEKGFFPKEELQSFGQYESILGGHPDSKKVPGVEVSSGSLGHGFPMAVGIALGLKILKHPAKVYALIGDGESNEGTIWESALLASHHKLDNLVCIVDYNHSGDRAVSVGNLAAKFSAFDWMSIETDGHNQDELYKTITSPHPEKPLCVVANTIKGNGSATMANQHSWHHKSPNKEEYETILKELED